MSGIIKPGPVPRCDAFCNECTDRSLGSRGALERGGPAAPINCTRTTAALPANPILYTTFSNRSFQSVTIEISFILYWSVDRMFALSRRLGSGTEAENCNN